MDDEGQHLIEDHSDGIPTVPDASDQQATPRHPTDTGTVHSSAELQQPGAGDHPLQIAFSVYTATNGYDWSNIPENSDHEGLDFYYQKAVERKPDFMSSGDVVKGVFACDGNVAVFRIQVVKHWDSFGRNADYCAFAFLTYEEAYKVDFEALLNMPEFTDPRHDPPTSISYSGEMSKSINSEGSVVAIKKLYHGEPLQNFDFAKIGALLSLHGNKSSSWLFCKVECAIENSTTVSTGPWNDDPYPQPPPPPPPPPQPERVAGSPLSAEQSKADVVLPEMAQVSEPSPLVSLSGSQATRRTVAVDAHLRAPIQASAVQATYRVPVQGRIRAVTDDVREMTPEEMARGMDEISRRNNVLDDRCFDMLLKGAFVFLVGVLIALIIIVLINTKYQSTMSFVPGGNTSQDEDAREETGFRSLDEDGHSHLGLRKGDK